MTNEEKIEKMLTFFNGSRTLKDLLLEMAEWKDNKFYIILACIKVSIDKTGLNGDKFIDEIKKQWEG